MELSKRLDTDRGLGSIAHLKAYEAELKSEVFKFTTLSYKEDTYQRIGWYMGEVRPESVRTDIRRYYLEKFGLFISDFGKGKITEVKYEIYKPGTKSFK